MIGVKTDKNKQNLCSEEDAKLMGNMIGKYSQVDLECPEKIDSVFTRIVDQILKFEKEDSSIKSMLEKLY